MSPDTIELLKIYCEIEAIKIEAISVFGDYNFIPDTFAQRIRDIGFSLDNRITEVKLSDIKIENKE